VGALVGGAAACAASAPTEAPPRPDAETIRAETENILAGPPFIERRSLVESIIDWFIEKLRAWEGPSLGGAGGWLSVLQWIILTWCVATLVAILAHFVWTLVTVIRSRRAGRFGGFRHGAAAAFAEASIGELEQWRDRLAREGRFREAVAVMLLLLLRHLEACDLLRFHASKTNGDYVREFPRDRDERDPFRRFVRACDVAVYGRAACGARLYERLGSDFVRIRDRVQQTPRI